jgi:hypothetical protein
MMSDAEVRVHSGPQAASATPNDLVWTDKHIWRNEGDNAALLDAAGNVISTFHYEAREL